MKPTFNAWPYAIILTFVLFISGTVGLVVMASHQREDLVSRNYYEQELKYQGQIDRVVRARALSSPAKVSYAHGQLRVTLPPEHAGSTATGQIQLYRPSEADLDRQLKLQISNDGTELLTVPDLRPGLWKVRLTWAVQDQEFSADQQLVVH